MKTLSMDRIKSLNRQFILLILVVFSFVSCQPEEKDTVMVEHFMEIYSSKGADEALTYFYSTNPHLSDVEAAKEAIDSFIPKFGMLRGYELIKTSRINDSYSIHSYILLYELQPVRFSFVLYKPSNEWRFQYFRYDSNLKEEMTNSLVVTWDS
ncbi:hypothetical protein [Carboxylicivirga sp. M1479]|uniref:hypothetical protein n=1 Tax=Carboxylicivirga sp. M1479 TaxID=2594476 RepID=UPI0011786F0E|nr:hypothetical protein [Carboxylicivirga sp. M1479]TRX61013.1 hypothetical protein FNN09_20550 [Carboxylicivirga sp. M1479]